MAAMKPLTDRQIQYREVYLNSPEWKRLRKRKLKKHRYCAFCHSERRLDVHHITYPADLSNTGLEHLRVVCRKHHDLVHDKIQQPAFSQEAPIEQFNALCHVFGNRKPQPCKKSRKRRKKPKDPLIQALRSGKAKMIHSVKLPEETKGGFWVALGHGKWGKVSNDVDWSPDVSATELRRLAAQSTVVEAMRVMVPRPKNTTVLRRATRRYSGARSVTNRAARSALIPVGLASARHRQIAHLKR